MGERHEEKEFLLLADLDLTGCHSDRRGIVEYPAYLDRMKLARTEAAYR